MTREEVIQTCNDVLHWSVSNRINVAMEMAIEALKQSEIIRCKDCKYWKYEEAINQSMCKNGIPSHDPDGFCHHAKPIK